ncbi:MAG TPA: hypothetical protein VE954_32940 [Oligoflexus sp.]|uniref:hypothetical protein n=1 Tax=Oligoflexus sp. TaxID=1971216 RepID=UPI002D394399|nr:hypothetical protein [Oligoflexus sp.]HYX37934.1 hypothetical protein [Oligoflexus sp.]
MRYLAIVFGLALTGACTTIPNQADVEGKVDSWLGMDAGAVKQSWGQPTQEVNVGADTKVVQYSSAEGEESCRVVLTFNAQGEVVATRWTGADKECQNFVKASPAYEMTIGEETNTAILEATENFQSRF